MPESTKSDLYVSWTDYHHAIEKLALKVYESGWEFNQIVCLARGGLRVGDLLSRLYRKPLAILFASSYGGTGDRQRGSLTFSSNLTMTGSNLGSHVLLVDDLVDSGVTLQKTIPWLQEHYAQDVQEIRTAVLWYKACSVYAPDYYVDFLPHNPWIHQPFELYEEMTLEALAEKHSSLPSSK